MDGDRSSGDQWDDDDPPGADDVEMLDDAWEQGHGGRGSLRWLLLLLVVPVVALVVMQLGPSGGPNASPSPSPSPTPTQTRSVPTSTPGRDATGQPGRPGVKREGAAGRPVVKTLGHPVLGVTAGWELFALADDQVTRIQLAAGRVTTTPLPTLGQQPPASFVVTAAGAFVLSQQGDGSGREVPDGHAVREITVGGAGFGHRLYGVVPGPDPDHVWGVEASGDHSMMVLLDSRLRPAGTKIPIPANVLAGGFSSGLSDGLGTPMVRTPGGTYALGPEGARRITTGVVVAAGPTRWVVEECDDANHCTRYVIDRETGTRTVLPGRTAPELNQGVLVGTVSPDGSLMAGVVFDIRGPTLALTDLRSGASHDLGVLGSNSFSGEGVMAWSPDGRWLFFPEAGGGVGAFDARSGKVTDLGLGLQGVQQVVVRPAS